MVLLGFRYPEYLSSSSLTTENLYGRGAAASIHRNRLPDQAIKHLRDFIASRNVGFVALVSARALIMLAAVDKSFDYEGRSPIASATIVGWAPWDFGG